MFKKIKDKMLSLAAHKLAVYYLAFFSFIESIFFPVPADVMLVPMVLAKPNNILKYCITIITASLLGGMLTYFISYYAFDYAVLPYLEVSAHYQSYLDLVNWFNEWGVVVFIIASASFIPYKLIAIVAAVVDISALTFFSISVLVRSIRFFLISYLSISAKKVFNNKNK